VDTRICYKYGNRLLNIKANPLKKKEVKFQVSMETEKQLHERLTKLGMTLRIKDNPADKFLYYDGRVNGKRHTTKSRYSKCTRDEALAELTKKQQELITELTIEFN